MEKLYFGTLEGMPDDSPGPDEIAARILDGEDPEEEAPPSTIAGLPADAIAQILRLVLPAIMIPARRHYWTTAATRLAALAWSCDPTVRAHSQKSIADALGVTRALLSLEILRLRDFANLSCAGGMSDRARKSFSQSTKQVWQRRKQQQKA